MTTLDENVNRIPRQQRKIAENMGESIFLANLVFVRSVFFESFIRPRVSLFFGSQIASLITVSALPAESLLKM